MTHLKSLIAERGADVEIHRPLLIGICESSLSISEKGNIMHLGTSIEKNIMIGD